MFYLAINRPGSCICSSVLQQKTNLITLIAWNSCKNLSACIYHIDLIFKLAITRGKCGRYNSTMLCSGSIGDEDKSKQGNLNDCPAHVLPSEFDCELDLPVLAFNR